MVSRYSFVLLAPTGASFPTVAGPVCPDPNRYRGLLSGMQALRGRTYLEDGAISINDVDAAGRLRLEDDEDCWHILLTESGQDVIGCVRMRTFAGDAGVEDLRVKHSALAVDPILGPKVCAAISADMESAWEHGLQYAEIGGWALAHSWRGTKAALDILTASYALGEMLGGCLGIATATFRHDSASILKKVGATPFVVDGEELQPYHDPRYGCTMQLLRFTRKPVHRYALLIAPIQKALERTPVLTEGRLGKFWTRPTEISKPYELIREVA